MNAQAQPARRFAFGTFLATIAASAGLVLAGLVGGGAHPVGAHDHGTVSHTKPAGAPPT
jgi:hypothetical protein